MRISFYGDDFTGSTDVMEALVRAGVPTVLFVEPPRPEQLERYPQAEAVGIAGWSRSMTPAEMDEHLPPVFQSLRALGAPLVHYKTCSTFDSSPRIGSIGRAIDLGQREFRSPAVPLLVGAPVLGRYTVFGNLFARSGLDSEPYRLDRHPTMRRHPITPMDEADLALHLSRQTTRRIGLMDVLHLERPATEASARLKQLVGAGSEVVLLDVLYERHLSRIGQLIEQLAAEPPLLVVGSSGVEYALTAWWRDDGRLSEPPSAAGGEPVEQLLVVSGSCAPVTDRQIAYSVARGFQEVALDAAGLLRGSPRELDVAVERVVDMLQQGQSLIVHSSRGPDDPRIRAARELGGDASRRVGEMLGTLLRGVLQQYGMRRVAVTGGDTSGVVARALGVEALEMVGPLAPGSPLCRASAADPVVDGLEVTFKGGQVGRVDFFDAVLAGRPTPVR